MTPNPIIHKLDAFIRKYYKNQLIKGLIFSLAILLSFFLIAITAEYFGYLSSTVRALIFWIYLILSLSVLSFYVLLPLLRMYRLGHCISYQQAAKLVGDFFPEVKDKLLNLLQLQETASSPDSDLLQACIRQKTDLLSPIPFRNAVNLHDNKKYIKFVLPPLAVLLLALLFVPSAITAPSSRIVHYNTHYQRPAPFSFLVQNTSLYAVAQQDFLLKVSVQGNAVPDEAFVVIDGNAYKMQRVDKTHFAFLFKQPRSNISFFLQGGGVSSQPLLLHVLPKPTIVDFSADLAFPSYIGRPNELIVSNGDLTVPRGTMVKWNFQTADVDTLCFLYSADPQGLLSPNAKMVKISPDANGRASLSLALLSPISYCFFARNNHSLVSDTLSFAVSVIDDAAPSISVIESLDSLLPDRRLFIGNIKDDYGFSHLNFKIIKTNATDTSVNQSLIRPISISHELSQEFYFSFDLNEMQLAPGDRLSYFFEVCDNDAISGPKCTSSQHFSFEIPTDKELDRILDQNSASAQQKALASISELKKLQNDIDDLMRKLVDKKDISWQDKQQLQELADRQKQVRDELHKMQQQINQNNFLEQKYREQNEQILQKQQQLEQLLNQVLDDKMKDMMNQIQDLINQSDKNKVQEKLQELKLNNDDLQKQIDQDIDLLKRLQLDKKVDDAVKKAADLAEQQRKLAQQSQSASKDQSDQLRQQQQLSQEFQSLKQEINQIQQDYKNLDQPADFNANKELQNRIDSHQNQAQQQLNKGNNSNASQQQKSAADDLQQLSDKLAQQQDELQQQQLAEDAEQVRQLLHNLLKLSFSQESLIDQVRSTYIQDPKYQSIILQQGNIKSDFKGVEDSLRAIAKRQVSVASAISKEVSNINVNVALSFSSLLEFNQSFYGNSKNSSAPRSMQYAMTSFNNLSLILAESLDNMQNQMRQNQQMKNGNCKRQGNKSQGNCSNPGSGKPSPQSIKQMQDELNKQMEALKKQLDKQGSPNSSARTKLGQQNSLSEQFAKMAAQQELIRRLMQEYGQQLKQSDASNTKLARDIDNMLRQMEQTESDLVNKVISQQTLQRQQQIMSRMLEHEKADLQREKEQRRQSHQAVDQYQPSPADISRLKKLKNSSLEQFHTTPPSLKPYYKNKVSAYFFSSFD